MKRLWRSLKRPEKLDLTIRVEPHADGRRVTLSLLQDEDAVHVPMEPEQARAVAANLLTAAERMDGRAITNIVLEAPNGHH